MNKTKLWGRYVCLLACAMLFTVTAVQAQSSKYKRLIEDTEKARSSFMGSDKQLKELFDNAYGYAIFPNIGKGAAGIGGAAGSGVVYEQGKMTGMARMKQLTVGWQIGGQAYREIIFFEDKESLDRFRSYAYEFAAQTSASAINDAAKVGAYTDGILVFTQKKTGLMYDESIGGQKFDYTAF